MQSKECLHVMRMMDNHVCTNRFRVHLESVNPLMKFGNDFRCDGDVLLHGHAVECEVAPSKTKKNPKVLSPIKVDL